jgi:hypothetical protein
MLIVCVLIRMGILKPDISAFQHPGYLSASSLILAILKTPIREIPRWKRRVKYRMMDEILSEDLWSVTTIRLEEDTRALNTLTLFFYLHM